MPDILDEARFDLESLMKMQVPAGKPMAGMAHHKIHGEKWTAIPTAPDKDDIKRFLRPVSTAATLNLAAAAAQAARLWKTLDPAFAAQLPDRRRDGLRGGAEEPEDRRRTEGRGRRHLRRRRRRPTSSTGRRRSCTSRPARQNYKDDLAEVALPRAQGGRRDGGRRARLGPRGARREDEPGRRAQRPRRPGDRRACARS